MKRTLAALLLISACNLYVVPEVPACTVKCGDHDACPMGTECKSGFCAQPGTAAACACHPGDQRECGGNGGIGECVPGVQTCRDEGVWSACIGEQRPSVEECDGKDNDCDGETDEEVATPLCSLSEGVCKNARATCAGGQLQPCGAAEYGADYEAVETRCDGKDNDCDGLLDEWPTTTIVPTTGINDWAMLPRTDGYAVVTVGTDAGMPALFVRRLDARLQSVSSTQLTSGSLSGISTVSLADQVVTVWLRNGELQGAVSTGTAVMPLTTIDAATAEAGATAIGLSVAEGRVRALFPARGGQLVRLAEWNLSTGASLGVRELTASVDAGERAVSNIENPQMSDHGHFAHYVGKTAEREDGGTSTLCYLHDLRDGGMIHRCSSSRPFEVGDQLTAVITSSFNFNLPFPIPGFEDYSEISVLPDLITGLPPVVIRKSADPNQLSSSNAYVGASGLPTAVFADNVAHQIQMASIIPAGSSLSARLKVVGTAGGYLRPIVVPTANADTAVVSWWDASKVSARQVCVP